MSGERGDSVAPDRMDATAMDVNALAERWARLLRDNPYRLVEEVYAPDVVVVHAGHEPIPAATGRQEFHRAEARIRRVIRDRRVSPVRVVSGAHGAVVEGVVTGMGPGESRTMACPSCNWWRLNDAGQIVHETAYWEWSKRRPQDATTERTIPVGDRRARSTEWYRDYADRMAHLWTADPMRMADELYAEGCLVERLGVGPEGILLGNQAHRKAEDELLQVLPLPHRRMTVTEVMGDRDALGIAFNIEGRWRGEGPLRRGPGSMVVTLDTDDRAVSARIYWYWSVARIVEAD